MGGIPDADVVRFSLHANIQQYWKVDRRVGPGHGGCRQPLERWDRRVLFFKTEVRVEQSQHSDRSCKAAAAVVERSLVLPGVRLSFQSDPEPSTELFLI